MQKGIVLESDKKWTVVLTPDGQFCKVPTQPHYMEGMEITFQPAKVSQVNSSFKFGSPKFVRTISAVAACILLFVCVFPFLSSNPAYAAVTIDINPSIQLEVDKDANVVDVQPLNADAKVLVSHIQWKNKKVEQVTLEVIDAAQSEGLMNSQHQVIITTTLYKPEGKDQQEQLDTMLRETAAKTNPELTVVVVDADKKWVDEAKKQNITLGSYSVVKQAEQQGIHVQAEDIQKGNLEDLPEVHGVNVIHPQRKKNSRPTFKANQQPSDEPQDNQRGNSEDSGKEIETEKNANKLEKNQEHGHNFPKEKHEQFTPDKQGGAEPSQDRELKSESRTPGQDKKKEVNDERDREGEQNKGKKNNDNRGQKKDHGEEKDHKTKE